MVQVRVNSDLVFQSHEYQFCKEDIVHKSANKVLEGSQAGWRQNLGHLWWSLPPSFPLGNCFFSVLHGSDGLLIIEPHSLALLVHSDYYNEVP